MDESNGVVKVEEARSLPRRLTLPREVDHRLHGGTGLFPAVGHGATPVLQTAATTEVAEDQIDGGDGAEPSLPNASEIVLATLSIILFEGQIFNFYISETVRARQKCVRGICRFLHLPSNGVFTKIVLCDLYLHLEG